MATHDDFGIFMGLSASLDDAGARLLDDYLEAERHGIRRLALSRLDAFVAWAQAAGDVAIDGWVDTLCDAVRAAIVGRRQHEVHVTLRVNLLTGLLLPRLVERFHAGDRRAVSGLVALADFIYYKVPQSFLESHRMPIFKPDFLRLALDQCPDDGLALQQLVGTYASSFDYAIHEVPSGVLTNDIEGSLLLLTEFKTLVERGGWTERFAPFIANVERYLRAWAAYRRASERYGSFEDYLVRESIPYTRIHVLPPL